ncbi:peptidylprolyl isomerase [Leptolyngbya sp. 7M]|uniref:peptidylprolyl isomerase n=1 Tax=Leptolyngbya sp. 7M TaxID=2812896 RepID=UPI001B8B4048|nr:peptidylprolyl isomerase [Leptolyngbya sp. 7M]QYO65401.1 peptidyl-prolyl cis-trans isomerase [Leptolyngbya sp. 7M]
MLKLFRRLERTRNFVLLLFAIVMVLSLVLFYAPTRGGLDANLINSTESAAKVGSEYITVGEIARQKQAMSQFMQGRPYPTRTVLNGSISGKIIRLEAARLGLTASDAEVAAEIREQNKPEEGKQWDQLRYEQNVTNQFGSVRTYEESVRDQISGRKLQTFLTAGVTVSEEELIADFQRSNTKFDLSYIALSPATLAQTIVPTDAELRDYFEKNKSAYYISMPQKKIRYVFVNTAKIGEKLPITDEDLRAEYDKLPEDKRISGVLGQEIVLRVAKPEFDGKVYEKANELVSRLRKDGATVTKEAFAELAKGFSENPASAGKGGDLPGPVRENPNKPDDPYQRLIRMQPGEITEPINYQGRYFILRRGEAVPKSFEEAKKELDVSLRNRRAYEAAAALAERVAQRLKENKDVQATAQQFAAEANNSVAAMVRETGYIKPGDTVENIGVSPQFEDGIAPLENVNDVGDKVPIPDGFAVPMLIDRKEPRDAEFEEVKTQLVEVVKLEQARNRVEEIANRIASGAANAAALAALASGQNVKANEAKAFTIGSPLGEGPTATTNKELEDAIFALKPGEVTKTPIKIGENYYIVGAVSRQDASMDDFAKQRTTLMEQKLSTKRNEVFSEFLAATRQRMESSGQIRIYNEAIERIDAADAANTPTGLPQGFPGLPPQ